MNYHRICNLVFQERGRSRCSGQACLIRSRRGGGGGDTVPLRTYKKRAPRIEYASGEGPTTYLHVVLNVRGKISEPAIGGNQFKETCT